MANNTSVREEMTVHQALCELKTLNKRIVKAIAESKPISTKEHNSQKVDGMTIAEFKALAQSAHDSAVDLIRRQAAIKAAVNQYNAEKTIEVCGKTYTIAQAIWLMSYGLNEEKDLLSRYASMLNSATAKIERANGDELNRRAETFTVSACGAKDKVDPKEYMATLEEYKEKHAIELVDPLGIRKIISDLEKRIADFESNVDSAIQVANATTTLSIEY